MPLTDSPLEELWSYRPEVGRPADFEEFWSLTLQEARSLAGPTIAERARTPLSELEAWDLTFSGFGGDPIRAWLLHPLGAGPFPVVVEFIGYGGGRGLPTDRLGWAASGFAHLVMDTRGQGSAWPNAGPGATADPHGSESAAPGFLTRGISDPSTSYYRRLHTDAVLLVEAAARLDIVDPARIAVTGVSQGGGVCLAAAALSPLVRAVMPDVPFLCHFERFIARASAAAAGEIRQYLTVHQDSTAEVLRSLSYMDGACFAGLVTAPTLISVALMDDISLPSTVFAAYHQLQSAEKEMAVYPYNGHEGGGTVHWARQVDWLRQRLPGPSAE
ncbi:acetylxylan esterase [Bogoriella caseilytica]|uniref:Cephalosporin-C deacetylase n=1 Tax=Bogoriella caseilytica TaxID=56055 RepID=A0A3N2BDV9_9MICO|nr:acetylxylan esterase [Bogoriella caseilytica]ROR73436.1 cephalosporin-C deacetylase [Bogoriella caseilytica]